MITPYKLPESLSDAVRYFADADRAFSFLAQLRWPDGARCVHCNAENPIFLKTRRIFKCRDCRKQFSV
ncbi:MAG: transposase, partial [Gemmatimonadota bacterium]